MSKSKTNKEALSLGGMYRMLFTRLKSLLVTPQKEWPVIFSDKSGVNEILTQFSLPLIGIYTVAVFIGYLLSHKGLNFEIALKKAVFVFSACFFGLYATYLLLWKGKVYFNKTITREVAFKLIAFPSSVLYVVGTITELFPEMFFIGYLLNMYVVYLVWVAINVFDKDNKEKQILNTAIISLLILVLPELIERFLVQLSELTI